MSIFGIKKTPLRIQSDPLECGAVCLGIIIQYFGRYESTQTLKERAQVSRMGSNAKDLMYAASTFHLHARAHKRSATDLKYIKSVGILFFDQCHFVVYEGFFGGKYYINDPGLGRYALAESIFRSRYGGVIIEIAKGEYFRKNAIYKREAWSALSKPFFYGITALGIFAGLLLGLSVMLLGYLLANAVAQYSNIVSYFLIVLSAILCANFIIFWPLCKKIINAAIISSDYEEKNMLQNMAKVSLNFFEERPFAAFKAAYMSAFSQHIAGWQARVLKTFYLTMILVLFFFLFTVSLKIFLLALFLCVSIILLKHLFSAQISAKEFNENNLHNKISAMQEKAFDMAKDMAAMGQNERLTQPIMQAEMALLREEYHKPILTFLDKYLASIFLALFWLGFSIFASNSLKTTELPLNELVAGLMMGSFLLIIVHFYLGNLKYSYSAPAASFLRDLQESSLSESRITRPTSNKLVTGSFSHTFAQRDFALFSDTSVMIEKGKIYGLVGEPLSGKSTLLKILARKITPSKNALQWSNGDGSPLKIGLIDADSDVFLGTLRDNVSLWDSKKTESQIAEALALACCEELFFNRSLGLLSPIYAHGSNISGGQKKRLMLARALLVNPDLLILDNFFETLDADKVFAILNNIKKLNISCVFSTYNSDYLEIAHEVIFLNAHQAVFGKSHKDLLIDSAAYEKLITNSAA